MIDVEITVVQLPPADPGGLRAIAGTFDASASACAQQASRVVSLTGSLPGGNWQGDAARVWSAEGHAQAGYLRRGVSVFGDVAKTLRTLAGAIESAQTAAARANSDASDAFRRRQAEVQTAALSGRPIPSDADYQAAMGRAETAGRAALRDFQQAGKAAAQALQAAAGAAPAVMPIPGPARPRGPLGNQPSFLTLLLGSVVGNGIAGRAWQELVLRDLGLQENFSLIPPELLFGRSRPDALTETEMYELKNVLYQSNSRQLRVQLRYADRMGLRYNLIVNRITRISGPLRSAIQDVGGRILRYQGNGLYKDVTEGDKSPPVLLRRVGGRFEHVDLQPKSITEEPQPVRGGGPTVENGPAGRAAPEEEPPVAPEPEAPEVQVPEVEIP